MLLDASGNGMGGTEMEVVLDLYRLETLNLADNDVQEMAQVRPKFSSIDTPCRRAERKGFNFLRQLSSQGRPLAMFQIFIILRPAVRKASSVGRFPFTVKSCENLHIANAWNTHVGALLASFVRQETSIR